MSNKNFADYGFGQSTPEQATARNPADMHFPAGYTPFGGTASNPLAATFGTRRFAGIGEGKQYISTDWTATTTGTSAAAASDAGSGGVLLTCGSTSTFNTNLQSFESWTPAPNGISTSHSRIRGHGSWLLQTSDITTVGFELGFGSSAVDPATTNYTDCIKIKMAVGAGTVIGAVRGDSGTQAVSATLTTMVAATDMFFAVNWSFGNFKNSTIGNQDTTVTTGASSATQTVGSTAGMAVGDIVFIAGATKLYRVVNSITNGTTVVLNASVSTTTADAIYVVQASGEFWAGTTEKTATVTAFTTAQLIQLGQILSTPVAMFHNISAKGSAATPTVKVSKAHMEMDWVS